jgi:outer membrane protein OmpA-like peptidoglycan-associated protein
MAGIQKPIISGGRRQMSYTKLSRVNSGKSDHSPRGVAGLTLGVAALALVLSACSSSRYVDVRIAEANAEADRKIESLESEVERLQEQARRLETQTAEAAQSATEALQRAQEAGVLAKGRVVFEQSYASQDITFASGSTTLSADARAILDDLAAKLTSEETLYLEIQGHADDQESAPDALAHRRAETVRRYLRSSHGIPLSAMNVISYGDQSPVASNKSARGRGQNRRVSVIVLEGVGGLDFRASRAPLFPWPPPMASGTHQIPMAMLSRRAGVTTLGDVAARLQTALERAGYSQGSFFAVPGGFALVTRLEHINSDGSVKPASERWLPADSRPLEDFTLSSYIRALFQARRGYYRVMAFIVTPLDFAQAPISLSPAAAKEWVSTGSTGVPPSVRNITLKPATHRCTALIYEFQREADDDPIVPLIPSQVLPRIHLEKAGILAALTQAD